MFSRLMAILILVVILYPVTSFAKKHPGSEPYDINLTREIHAMKQQLTKDYIPRTKHIDSKGNPEFTNRLFLESSPYLLQHAHNPVDWYPWGDEAFETAKKLDRPILLSIGYSTCHWCHVMEEESFEDLEIAEYINKHYIAIKVDREERPDIDSLYMKAVVALNGSGGWPMTVFVTWDKKPFYGGTYFPARDGDRGISTGFLTILNKLNELYQKDKAKIQEAGDQLSAYLKKASTTNVDGSLPTRKVIEESIQRYKIGFDQNNGGLRGQHKFPSSLPLDLLMRHSLSSKDDEVLKMVTLTLDKMMDGGVHDQVGGGFHRYTTDSIWLTPHYEKMLYDNALLSIMYTKAYQLTGEEKYKTTAIKTLDYILEEMQSPDGGFYSATDADSLNNAGLKEEGYFFTWLSNEVDALFDKKTADLVKLYYSMDDKSNSRQILHISENRSEHKKNIAGKTKISIEKLEDTIHDANKVLYAQRLKRGLPGLDDKILLSWNSLVISALAKAGFAFDKTRYITSAINAENFIFKNLWYDGILFHSYKDNKRGHAGFLNDYAFIAAAYIDLYEATFDLKWLHKAIDVDGMIYKEFEDKQNGGFFMIPAGQKDLLAREKVAEDGALPSGNSIAVSNLIKLYSYTDQKKYHTRAIKALTYFSSLISQTPERYAGMITSLDRLTKPARQIIIITPGKNTAETKPFFDILRKTFFPNTIIVLAQEGKKFDAISKIIPHVRRRKVINDMVTAYPCEDRTCKLPVTDPAKLLL